MPACCNAEIQYTVKSENLREPRQKEHRRECVQERGREGEKEREGEKREKNNEKDTESE